MLTRKESRTGHGSPARRFQTFNRQELLFQHPDTGAASPVIEKMELIKALAALALAITAIGYTAWAMLTAEIDRKKIDEMDRQRRQALGIDDPVRLQPENHRHSLKDRHQDHPGQTDGD